MKIRSHSEIVELDGSRWQVFPGDLDLTPNWKPETDLAVTHADRLRPLFFGYGWSPRQPAGVRRSLFRRRGPGVPRSPGHYEIGRCGVHAAGISAADHAPANSVVSASYACIAAAVAEILRASRVLAKTSPHRLASSDTAVAHCECVTEFRVYHSAAARLSSAVPVIVLRRISRITRPGVLPYCRFGTTRSRLRRSMYI